jgi:hypothetical protein
MVIWEYKAHIFMDGSSIDDKVKKLNDFGQEGWEALQIFQTRFPPWLNVAFLKRPVKQVVMRVVRSDE